jgi:ubiquinone/menaquinone biosynthesis C-methylase UbiE
MGRDGSAAGFKMMALSYRVRDALRPRRPFLKEAGLTEGMTVLDFGCGPGSYVIPAAHMMGPSGRVYALDIRQAALTMARDHAAKVGLTNVETILSDCDTGLPERSVDVALLYDVYHDLAYPMVVLKELHRILKVEGVLSSHDHHLKTRELKRMIESSGLFRATMTGKRTLTFAPERKEL